MDGSIFVVDVVFNFSGKPAKTNAPTFGVVLVVPTGWFPEEV